MGNKNWKSKVVSNFEAHAHEYDQHNEIQQFAAANLMHDAPNFDGADILEIGCGTGALTKRLIEKYPKSNCVISDISAKMVEQAKASNLNSDRIEWRIADGEDLEIDQRFDLIVSNMAVQWFENLDRSLEALKNNLKPGGQILYSMPAPTSFTEWKATLKALSLPIGLQDFKMPDSIYKYESKTITYDTALDFLKHMKHLGAGTPREGYHPLSATQIRKACRYADKEFGGQITWTIMYGKITA